MAEPGFDPTLEPRRRGPSDLRRGGAGNWLGTLGLGAIFAAVLAFGFRGQIGQALAQIQPATTVTALSATSAPTVTAASVSAPLSGRPTRTPVVWPTLGVLRLTPTGGPPQAASPSPTAAIPTLEGSAPSEPVSTSGSSATPAPTQTARVVYQPGGGGAPATVVVYVTVPPAATYTPLPTYTALPTYTQVPASPTPTHTPEPTATCPPLTGAEPSAPGAYVIYLPQVFGSGPTASCTP